MAIDAAYLASLTIEKFDGARHDRNSFSCGVERIDNFLRISASKYVKDDNGRIYVALQPDGKLVGFHALGPHAIDVSEFDDATKKRLPPGWATVPAFYLSMLGVDRSMQAKGLGTYLIGDVFHRCLAASDIIGGRFIVLDAINEMAAALYARLGFQTLPSHPGRMIISMAKVRASAEAATPE